MKARNCASIDPYVFPMLIEILRKWVISTRLNWLQSESTETDHANGLNHLRMGLLTRAGPSAGRHSRSVRSCKGPSVFCRTLHRIDHEDVARFGSVFEPQAKLFLNRRKDGWPLRKSRVAGACIRGPMQIDVESPLEARAINDGGVD